MMHSTQMAKSNKNPADWLRIELEKPGRSRAELARFMSKDPSVISRMAAGTRQIKAVELAVIEDYLAMTADGLPRPEERSSATLSASQEFDAAMRLHSHLADLNDHDFFVRISKPIIAELDNYISAELALEPVEQEYLFGSVIKDDDVRSRRILGKRAINPESLDIWKTLDLLEYCQEHPDASLRDPHFRAIATTAIGDYAQIARSESDDTLRLKFILVAQLQEHYLSELTDAIAHIVEESARSNR